MVKHKSINQIIKFSKVQTDLSEGIKLVYNLIYHTYGPNGRNIVIDSTKRNNLELCKQGSKIVSKLNFRDKKKNLVMLLMQDSFQKINSVSGDGSKTFFLITSSLILNGFKYRTNPIDLFDINTGIQRTLEYSLNLLSETTKPIQNVKNWEKAIFQFIPSDENINSIVKEVFKKIGKSGRIRLDSKPGYPTSVEIEHGLQLNKGYFSPYFINNTEKLIVEFDNPYILLSKQKLSMDQNQLIKMLELLVHTKRPLLIISTDLDNDVLSTLILNKINSILEVAYIKLPVIFGSDSNIFDDLAIYTGAKLINNYTDLRLFSINDFGQAKKIVITKAKTTIWAENESKNNLIKERSNLIKTQILSTKSTYENEKLEERYKNFNAANAIIKIGGITDIETQELLSRVETGLIQVKNCLYEGILNGSVLNYALITENIENWSRINLKGNTKLGSQLVIKAFLNPLQALSDQTYPINNFSSLSSDFLSLEQLNKLQSVDHKTIKRKIDKYFQEENIQPFKNVKTELKTSASLTNSLLSIGHFVI